MTLLDLFDKYYEWLDDEFDDCLIITYEHFDQIPLFKIVYDPTVSLEELKQKIPQEWKDAESKKEINILLKEYDNDYAKKILEEPVLVDEKTHLKALLKLLF